MIYTWGEQASKDCVNDTCRQQVEAWTEYTKLQSSGSVESTEVNLKALQVLVEGTNKDVAIYQIGLPLVFATMDILPGGKVAKSGIEVAESATKIVAKTADELATQARKVTAPIDWDGHILNAEVKSGGRVVGGHSTAAGNIKVVEITKPPNAQGVYQAKIQVADPNNPGQFLPKTNGTPPGTSTMFPDAWTPDRIKVEVDAAFKNRIDVLGEPKMWQGTTPSGVKVEGYLIPKTTVYPKL